MFLRFDDYNTVFGNAMVAVGQQFFLVNVRQGRGTNIKSQMYGSGDLIDVLAACSLGTDGLQFNFIVGDGNSAGND